MLCRFAGCGEAEKLLILINKAHDENLANAAFTAEVEAEKREEKAPEFFGEVIDEDFGGES